MKYPSYVSMLNDEINTDSGVETIYNTLILCLDKLRTDEEIIEFANESKEEVQSFIEQLSTKQFTDILEFVNDIPSLRHELTFDCTNCGHKNNAVLQGINDFF
jgi:predicted house-cleaning noncanonical NTP pyrophosphatase (MazG superfamily)